MVRRPLVWMAKEKQKWALERAACENNVLDWLEKQSAVIPAPRVLYSIPDYSILTKAPGKTLFECFGSFDIYQKVSVFDGFEDTVLTVDDRKQPSSPTHTSS